jgi:hypothetical protein
MQENLWDENSRKEFEMFVCPQCDTPKPSVEFNANASKPSGRDYCCKDCTHKRQTAWYEKNQARSVNKSSEWRKTHPEEDRERHRKYNETHREQIRAKDKKWRDANKNKDRQRKRDHENEKRRAMSWEKKAAKRCNERAHKKGLPSGMKPADLYDPNTGALPIFCPITPTIRLDYNQGYDRRCWATVDKKVPALGYTSDNVWVVSNFSNMLKTNGTNPKERKRIVEIMFPKPKSKPRKNNPAQNSLFD